MTLSEEIYCKLKEKLAFLEEGEFISARNCANELNVSLTPVREALLRLTNEGYLNKVPQVGFFKASIDYNSVEDFIESRIMVESYVMPRVVRIMTEDDIAYLEDIIKKQETCIEEKKVLEYGELDVEFHCYMVNLLGNKSIGQFYENIRGQLRMYSKKNYISRTTIQEHRKFLKLVTEKEYNQAIALIVEPLENFMSRMHEGAMRM